MHHETLDDVTTSTALEIRVLGWLYAGAGSLTAVNVALPGAARDHAAPLLAMAALMFAIATSLLRAGRWVASAWVHHALVLAGIGMVGTLSAITGRYSGSSARPAASRPSR